MSLKKDEILKVRSDNLIEKSLLLLEVFLSLSPPLFLSLQIFFSLTFSLSANLTLSLQKLDFEKVLLQAHKLTFHRKFDFPHNSHLPTLSQQSFPLLVTSFKLIFLPPSLSLSLLISLLSLKASPCPLSIDSTSLEANGGRGGFCI